MKPNLYLINGRLGAGKTTFLKELLKQPGFVNARVIENEFASSSIDTHTLHEHTAEVRTIAGVCICCGSGEELVEALQGLKNSSEPVIIEATGVANSLKLIEKLVVADIFADYTLKHGVFVLDAAENPKEAINTFADELKGADTVLVSKTDIITADQYAQIKENLISLGVGAVIQVNNGHCDFNVLKRDSEMLAYFADFDGDIAAHDTNTNYTVTPLGSWKVDPQKLQQAWPTLQQTYSLRRLKGDGVSADGTKWHIEATPSQCRITPGNSDNAQLVWIGAKARDISLDTVKKLCQ